MLIRLGIAVFGIFTGIGLIRLSNWARISILIFSGLTVFFGAPHCSSFRQSLSPSTRLGRLWILALLLVYGIALLISIW